MKGTVNLHTNTRRYILIIISYSLLSFLLLISIGIAVDGNLEHLITLEHSFYQYSATINTSVGIDDYYQFQAGISLSKSRDIITRINAEVVMQIPDSWYTDAVAWNANSLEANEIAVTSGIARKYGLDIGSSLFSKHVVDGTIHEYTVKEILSDASGIRMTGQSASEGIIIMGSDELYTSNITPYVMTFTGDDINILQRRVSGTPSNILYREDEIGKLKGIITPYIIALLSLSFLASVAYVLLTVKEITHYFKRLIALGSDRKILNRTFDRHILLKGTLLILITALCAILVLELCGYEATSLYLPAINTLADIIAMLMTTLWTRFHIWRTYSWITIS